MEIGGLQKLTLIDYPGKLACTVFLLGCNFKCPWCYSAELVLPEKIEKQQIIPEKYFFDFLKERKELLDGVVICGGEPTIQTELVDFIKKIKKLGYFVKLDTNGSNPNLLESLIKQKLIDYVAVDIKAPKEKYLQMAGISQEGLGGNFFKGKMLEYLEKSIKILKAGEIDYEFRTTIVPNVLEKKDILEIARWIGPAKKYFLQSFRPEKTIDPKFENITPYPEEYLLDIKEAISPFFEQCQIR